MRAVLDTNVLVSSLLSTRGAPSRLLVAWLEGAFELIVSPILVAEVGKVAGYPKIARRIDARAAQDFLELLSRATLVDDALRPPPVRAADPADDYLIGLAAEQTAVLVSGDRHLLQLADRLPVYTPAEFLEIVG